MIELSESVLENKKLSKISEMNNYDSVLMNKNIQIECVMNNFCLFDEKVEYESHQCSACIDKMEYICHLCIQYCHKNHIQDSSNKNPVGDVKTVSLKYQICQCALNDHNQGMDIEIANNYESVKNFQSNNNSQSLCPLNEIINYIMPNNFYIENETGNSMCIYCIFYCLHKNHENLENEFTTVDRLKYSSCLCEKITNHFPMVENLNNISSLITDRQFDRYINRYKFPGKLLNNEEFLNNYMQAFYKKHTELVSKINQKKTQKFYFADDKLYLECLNLFSCIFVTYSSKLTFYNIFQNFSESSNVSVYNLKNSFDVDFLIELFSLDEINNDNLFEIKLRWLNFFRKFIFSPNVVGQRNFSSFDTFENVNPFHRLLFGNIPSAEIDRIYEEPPTNRNELKAYKFSKYDVLIEKVFNSLINYSDKIIDESFYTMMAVEFLKIMNLIIPYFYLDKRKMEISLAKVLKLMDVLKLKKKNENLLKNTLEKIIYNLIYFKNDYVLFTRILEKNEKQIKENSLPLNFAFQNNDSFNKELIYALFAYEKDPTQKSDYLLRNEIYDILINEYDYYIENIENFNESNKIYNFISYEILHLKSYSSVKEDYLSKKLLEIFFQINYEVSTNEEIIEKNKSNENFISECLQNLKLLTEILKSIDEIYLNLIYSKIDELEFFNQICNKLLELNSFLKESYIIDSSERKIIIKKQILFFKVGGFDKLVALCRILKKVKHFQTLSTSYNNTIEKILEIFVIVSLDNPFICCLFFNSSIIKSLLKGSLYNIYFFCNKLKILNKYEYKINTELFLDMIISQFNFFDWKDENNPDMFILILKSFLYILKNTSKKSIMRVNDKICSQILKILSTTEFVKELNDIYIYLYSNPREKPKDNVVDEYICESDSDSTIYNLKDSTTVIFLIYTCINHLKSEFFYLLIRNLYPDKIAELLNLHCCMQPELRRILTKTYSRYFIEDPFKIYLGMSLDLMSQYNEKKVDVNLHSQIIIEEYNKKNNVDIIEENEEEELSDYENDSAECNSSKMSISFAKTELPPDNLKLLMHNFSQHDLSITINAGLKPIIKNFEKYRVVNTYFQNELKNNLTLSIQYFEDVILYPAFFTIYKVTYFSNDVVAKLKYIVFNMINLFLICFKFFIENLRKLDLNNIKNIEIISKLFNPPDNFFDEKTGSLMKQFTMKLLQDLDTDLKNMNSESFEQLNLKMILDIYFKFLNYFVFYKNYNDDKSKSENKKILANYSQNELTENISNLVQDYKSLKEDFFNQNILCEIYSIDVNKEPEIQNVKNTIALDLLFKFELTDDNSSISLYRETNTTIIESIKKLFKTDPNTWQNVIVDSASITKNIFISIIQEQLPFLFQYIFIEFNKLLSTPDSHHYNNFINLLEFLRLLCEDHNKIFQTFLITSKINDGINNSKELFVNFIFKTSNISILNVQYFKDKKEIISYFKPKQVAQVDFFDKLIIQLTDFLVEIIQGALSSNFKQISINEEFKNYYETHYKFLDSLLDEPDYGIFIANFIRFINSFIEENSNLLENKTLVIKKLNPKKLMSILLHSFKNLYISNCTQLALNDSNTNAVLNNIFITGCHKNLINEYINREQDFLEDPLFMIASGIFTYLKRTSHYKIGESVKNTLDKLEYFSTNPNEDVGKKNPWVRIIKKELYDFLNKLIKEVEVSYKFTEAIDNNEFKRYKIFFENDSEILEILSNLSDNPGQQTLGLDNVIFLVNSLSLFLSPSDYFTFMHKAPYDNFNNKLTYFFEYYPTIINYLQMRKQLWKMNSKFLSFFFNLKYDVIEILSALFSLTTCVLLFISLKFELIKVNTGSEASNEVDLSGVNVVINNPIQPTYMLGELNNPYQDYVMYIAIIHLIMLGITIINWISFSFYKLMNFRDKIKEEGTNFLSTVLTYLGVLLNPKIFPIVWNFVFGVLATVNKSFIFLYALQLFSIFNISPTMSSVLFAVRIRYKQFASTGFLLCILMLFYASVTLKFFRGGLWDDSIQENYCETFLQCFLYLINYGIRSGEGVHFSEKGINTQGYWSELIYSWVFYFIIMLIILNIVNGIIVDTFQALREQNNERDNVLENECYICSLNRFKFEIKGISFEDHRLKQHNLLNYYEYMIKIKCTDEHDLNSLDFEVLKCMNEHTTEFFPVKKAKCFMDL